MSINFLTHKNNFCKVKSSENSLYWMFREQDYKGIFLRKNFGPRKTCGSNRKQINKLPKETLAI